jgi:hypothetical protein
MPLFSSPKAAVRVAGCAARSATCLRRKLAIDLGAEAAVRAPIGDARVRAMLERLLVHS